MAMRPRSRAEPDPHAGADRLRQPEARAWAGGLASGLASIRQGVLAGAAVLVLILPPAGFATRQAGPAQPVLRWVDAEASAAPGADFAAHPASADARLVANWIVGTKDNQQRPFVILDKRDARLFVFRASGVIVDASPVLLGAAAGDDSVAGIGERPMALVRPEERTTPAGRFVSEPGRNVAGEEVVWVDYDAAVSMHRVRIVDLKERRLARLASPDPAERRISYGCINVPVEFFETVVWPAFGSGRGVVYVLPETKAVRQVFAGVIASLQQTHVKPPPSTPS